MEVKSNYKNIKKRKFNFLNIFQNRLIILLIIFTYSASLISIYSKNDKIENFIDDKLSGATKQLIKDSLPYQLHKSGYSISFLNNYISGLTYSIKPLILDLKYKDYEKLLKKKIQLSKMVF